MRSLIDYAKCVATVRALRWPDGVRCPTCASSELTKPGRDDTQPERPRSLCKSCHRPFDEFTDMVFAGPHQPLRVWMPCRYCMGLKLSHAHMAKALDLHPSDVHQMISQWRQGLVAKQPSPPFTAEGEGAEVSSVAGHQGQPDEVANKSGADGADGSRASGDGARVPPRRRRFAGCSRVAVTWSFGC